MHCDEFREFSLVGGIDQGVNFVKFRFRTAVAVLVFLAALPRPGEAQDHILTAEEIGAVQDQYYRIQADIKKRSLERCGPVIDTAQVVGYPGPGDEVRFRFSLDWSGGCRAGMREGLGSLSTTYEEHSSYDQGTNVEFRKSEGHAVNGHDQGLWCDLEGRRTTSGKVWFRQSTGVRVCYVLAGSERSGSFRKLDDGRWEAVDESGKAAWPSVLLTAGTLEAEGDRILSDAAAGKANLALRPFTGVKSQLMEGLVAGSKLALSESKTLVSIKGKRLALVLSSSSIGELERFTVERQALIDASAGLAGDVLVQRTRFIEASRPELLMQGIARELRKLAGSVEAVEDLTALSQGIFDYAFVVEWRSLSNLGLLGHYQRYPAESAAATTDASLVAGQGLGGILVTPELKASWITASYEDKQPKQAACKDGKNAPICDEAYLRTLADFYQARWLRPESQLGPFAGRFQ